MRGWWVAALCVLLVFFLLMLPPAQKGAKEEDGLRLNASARAPSLGIYSAELADAGAQRVAVMRLFLHPQAEGARLAVFCSNRPVQKSVLIINHTAAPGISRAFPEKIAASLGRCGLSLQAVPAEAAKAAQDAVVIAPTGALPAGLSGMGAVFLEQNSRLLVVETLGNRSISQDGRISVANESWFEAVPLLPGAEDEAAAAVARLAVLAGWQETDGVEIGGGNATFAIAAHANGTYCRAVYFRDGVCRFSDTGRLGPAPGRLLGPSSVQAGQAAVFEFSPDSEGELGRNLRFYAMLQREGQEVLRREIAGGRVAQGWASRFSLQFPAGGKYVLAVADQFGRVHARAYVRADGLQVTPVGRDGSRYEFFAEYGGEPAGGLVEAWIDEGEHKQYLASNGTLVVWASPSAGKRTMHFSFRGSETDYPFVAEGGGVLDAYLRLGIPALIFLAAVFLLAGARRKPAYTITFPQFAGRVAEERKVSERDILRAYRDADGMLGGHRLPSSLEELSEALERKLGGSGEVAVEPHSLLRALRRLCSRGVLAESEGMFIPVKETGGFSAEECRILRLLHDVMLERGLPFAKKRLIRAAGLDLELMVGGKNLLQGLAKRRRVALFAGREEVMVAEKSLEGPGRENAKVKLALLNGKLSFAAAKRKELEAILP